MGAKSFQLTPAAQEIVEALKQTLDYAIIALLDSHDPKQNVWIFRHFAEGGGERAAREAARAGATMLGARRGTAGRERRCRLEAAVNDRWTLSLWARTARPLHPNAQTLLKWAAQNLAVHLPRRPVDDLPYPPAGGNGGPPGSAELGIPVWWARRTRH